MVLIEQGIKMTPKDKKVLWHLVKPWQYENIIYIIENYKSHVDYPGVASWKKACYNDPKDHELKLAAINEELNYHGVETLPSDDGTDERFLYCNSGDLYDITIMYDTQENRFFLASVVDLIAAKESGNLDLFLSE